MSADRIAARSAQDIASMRVRRWTVRAIGYGLIVVAGCAWMTRNDAPFLPSFGVQVLAAFFFTALTLAAIWIGALVGDFVGRFNGVLGFIVGLIAGGTFFFFVGIASTQIPVLGPAIDRFVALIE